MSSGSPKTQVVNIPLDGSMDQRTHARQVQAPQVISATNVRCLDIGSTEKRAGMSVVSGSFVEEGGIVAATAPGEGRLMACGDELLLTDGQRIGTLYTHPVVGDVFIDKGRVPAAISTRIDLDTSPYAVSQPDIAIDVNGTEFHVWCADDRTPGAFVAPQYDVYCTVIDGNDRGEVMSQKMLSDGLNAAWQPHVVTASTFGTAVFYTLSGTGTIVMRRWDANTLSWTSPVNLVTDGTTAGMGTHYRVCSDGGANYYLVYSRASTIRILQIDAASGSIVASIVSTETYGGRLPFGFGIIATQGEMVWISYSLIGTGSPFPSPVNVRASGYTTALGSQTVAPFTVWTTTANLQMVSTGLCRMNGTTAVVLMSAFHADTAIDGRFNRMLTGVISAPGSVVVSPERRDSYWAIPASTPFVDQNTGKFYAWAWVGGAYLTAGSIIPEPGDQQLQWTMMLLDLRVDDLVTTNLSLIPVTWQSPRYSMPEAPDARTRTAAGVSLMAPSSCVQAPNGHWYADGLIRRNNVSRVTGARYEAKFNSPDKFAHAVLGRTLVMAPGWYWDRKQMAEISFAHWPQKVELNALATGGFLKNGKSYAYVVIYEYVDGTGAVHRSKPSDPIIVETPVGAGTAASVEVTFPTLTITAREGYGDNTFVKRASKIKAVVYRAGPLDEGDPSFYRVQSDRDLPIATNHTGGDFTILDVAADFDYSSLALMKQRDSLYTQGNILPNVMPPSFTSIVTYHNRVWVSFGNTATYSKAFVSGEAVAFTDGFDMPFEEVDTLTALATMDDNIFFSSSDRIYALQCDGPTDANTLSDIRTPMRVATDKGIIDQRSVAVTPNGMMYQSSVGIQLMSRGGQVGAEPIGSRVQDDLSLYPEITSAIVHPTGGYVSFCCRNPSVGPEYDGIRLIYDYTTDRWTRDVVLRTGAVVGHGLLGEVVRRGLVYGLVSRTTNIRVYQETPANHLDDGAWVTAEVQLAEVHPLGLQGNMGVRRWQLNGQRHTDHDLSWTFYRNYESTPFDSNTETSDVIAAAPIEQFSSVPVEQRAESMRLVLRDAAPTGPGAVIGTGKGGSWVGIGVEVDPIDGKLWKLAEQERS